MYITEVRLKVKRVSECDWSISGPALKIQQTNKHKG